MFFFRKPPFPIPSPSLPLNPPTTHKILPPWLCRLRKRLTASTPLLTFFPAYVLRIIGLQVDGCVVGNVLHVGHKPTGCEEDSEFQHYARTVLPLGLSQPDMAPVDLAAAASGDANAHLSVSAALKQVRACVRVCLPVCIPL